MPSGIRKVQRQTQASDSSWTVRLFWRGAFRIFRVSVATLLAASLLALCGCESDRAVIWQAHVKSPDGHYQVNAATTQQSGPGNAALYTEVELSQRDGDAGGDILDLSHSDVSELVGGPVTVTWVNSTTLHLEYNPASDVTLQVVKAGGVNIESSPRSR